jgi:hypothetical protein
MWDGLVVTATWLKEIRQVHVGFRSISFRLLEQHDSVTSIYATEPEVDREQVMASCRT